jgi:pimeloyl-ACP methyl ester carboxylesterase
MILIPGLECSGEVWAGVIEHYKSSYQIHTLTLAGFAGQPATPLSPAQNSRLAAVRDDLIEYIRVNRLNRPIIVGHSLGGFLAFWVAATAPELVGRVIAVDGVPFLPALFNSQSTAAGMKEQAAAMRTMYASMKPEQMEAMSRFPLASMITDAKDVDRAAKWAGASDPATVGQVTYELMTTDLRQDVSKIQAPVLLIGAGKAFASDSEGLEKVRAQYEAQIARTRNHKVVFAVHALHFVMFDDLPFLLQTMDDFLKPQGAAHAG